MPFVVIFIPLDSLNWTQKRSGKQQINWAWSYIKKQDIMFYKIYEVTVHNALYVNILLHYCSTQIPQLVEDEIGNLRVTSSSPALGIDRNGSPIHLAAKWVPGHMNKLALWLFKPQGAANQFEMWLGEFLVLI